MDIFLNDQKITCADDATLTTLLVSQKIDSTTVLVERNGKVIREGALAPGDKINLYRVVAGG